MRSPRSGRYDQASRHRTPRMDPERKRALKKLGKAEVQRQSDEIRRVLDEANPADATSDAWIKGHKLGTERERWLRKRLPTLHRPQLDALFVVWPYAGSGWVPTPGGYVQCEDCGSALPSMRPKSWLYATGCRCGNITWWECLRWRRITVRRPDRVIAIKLAGRG